MKTNVLLFLLLTVLAVFIPDGIGNTIENGKLQIAHKPKKVTNKYSLPESFNTELSSLPQGFNGADIVEIYSYLSHLIPLKNEFEKTEVYQNKLIANTPMQVFAFVPNNINKSFFAWNVITPKYDPDREVVTVDISYSRYKIKRTKENIKQYYATNGFGAKCIVTKYSGSDYGIFPVGWPGGIRYIVFKMSADDARDLKKNYGILFVCKISPINKFCQTDIDYSEATIYNPVEYLYTDYLINASVLQIWVFNKRTGVIYAKETIESSL